MKTRAHTNRILEMIDEGLISEGEVLKDLFLHLSEYDVASFYDDVIDPKVNGVFYDE